MYVSMAVYVRPLHACVMNLFLGGPPLTFPLVSSPHLLSRLFLILRALLHPSCLRLSPFIHSPGFLNDRNNPFYLSYKSPLSTFVLIPVFFFRPQQSSLLILVLLLASLFFVYLMSLSFFLYCFGILRPSVISVAAPILKMIYKKMMRT